MRRAAGRGAGSGWRNRILLGALARLEEPVGVLADAGLLVDVEPDAVAQAVDELVAVLLHNVA